jgi:glycolate oxidase iron-sulfur subunit
MSPRVSWFDGQDAPDWKGLRSCVHCGLCLPACPTYREHKNEADSPRGRLYLMRALHEGRLELSETVREHIDLCLVCRGCETACPAGVPFGALMEATRGQLYRRTPRRGIPAWIEDRAFRDILPSAAATNRFAGALRLYQLSGLQGLARGLGLLKLFPRELGAAEALLPRIPSGSSRRALPARTAAATDPAKARVVFLVTCVMRPLYPEVNRATLRLLSLAGADVHIAPAQTCCGSLHAHSGRLEEARGLARKNLMAIEALEPVDYIVSNAAGCGASLRDYAHWLEPDPVWAERARRWSERSRDVMEVLAALGLPQPGAATGETVAMHDPCHLVHGQKVRAAPRELLRAAGYRVSDLEDSDLCCGSAGIYNVVQPEMAGGDRKSVV